MPIHESDGKFKEKQQIEDYSCICMCIYIYMDDYRYYPLLFFVDDEGHITTNPPNI